MANKSPIVLSVHSELSAISKNCNEPIEIIEARKDALRDKISTEGVNRPIYVWPHDGQLYILEGIDIYEVATELGLKAVDDYAIVQIELPDLEAAKKWRFERAATTQREIQPITRCFDVLRLYRRDLKAYQQRARENQRKGGKGQSLEPHEKKDALAYLADIAGVSRSAMGRAKAIFDEMKRDPKDPNPSKRPNIPSAELLAMIAEVESGALPLKTCAENVKNARERVIRQEKNGRGAPAASADFVCDHDFDSTKLSQIICGDSIDLMSSWAAQPPSERPQPSLIFGSPPYWIPKHEGSDKDYGKGRINYGANFHAMMERRGIKTFADYVERFLKPYMIAAYELLPKGGRFVIQVDNTRGRDINGNLRVFFHTHQIVRIAEEIGFIASSEIIWRKMEISGRKQGFGSRKSPNIRPNHEYIIVLRKDCNTIDGDFEFIGSDMNQMAISSWDEKSLEEWTERERTLYTAGIWDIGAARSDVHAATFPKQLADWVIRMFAPVNSVVLDPWNGTGTTSIMSILCKRRFLGIDIEPYNCETAARRVEAAINERMKIDLRDDDELRRKVN